MPDPIRVLHVEDDPNFGDLVASYLERESDRITVASARNAEEALEQLSEKRPDCVVSDYDMPGRNGIELLETVRDRYPNLPFILFTGKGSEEVASEAISAGATDYLQKGGGTEQYAILANRVQNAVERRRSSLRAENLERLRRLGGRINRALVQASSRDEIETAVCRIVADAEPYRFAWVGEVDPESDRVTPRAEAGTADGYLEEVSVPAGEGPDQPGPAAVAVQENRVAASQRVESDPLFDPWREAALERGFRSVAAVPLEYDGTVFGVLVVYAGREQLFDEAEQALLAELAADIAHAIHACKVRRELELRDQAIGEAPVGIVITGNADEGQPIRYVNDRFEEITGYDEAEIRGRNCRFLQGPETREEPVTRMREAIDEDEPVSVELRNYRKNGDRFWNRVSIAPLRDEDGTVTNYVGFQEEITDRKERERRLERQNERFDELASIVSHDLRTPVETVRGWLELAVETGEVEHVKRARDSIERLDDLREDLADTLRSREVVSETRRVGLGRLAEDAWARVDAADGSDLRVVDQFDITADPDATRRLLQNLFSNAVEHSEGAVTVRVGRTDGGFYVEDDGPGIRPENRDAVFEAGFTTKADGTGMGMVSVSGIVDAHGWRIEVADADALNGTRFEITV
ncbi:hypothetical protein GCM10027435_18460 [Haloparvum alkalitolerans]|uniref:sensor histidine kinase n=1 Tax=Haloparvum alkalitolerans TaxID=1042953 RepID=UPI003CF8DF59